MNNAKLRQFPDGICGAVADKRRFSSPAIRQVKLYSFTCHPAGEAVQLHPY